MMKAAPLPLLLLAVLSLACNLWLAGAPQWSWVLAALIAWYLADFVSGLTHMIMDYKPSRPGIGLADIFHYEGSRESAEYQALLKRVMSQCSPFEKLVYDFKNHHPRPRALGRRPMLVQIGSTILFGTLPASLLLNAVALAVPLPSWLMFGGVVGLVAMTFAQYFHGTLHRDDNPPLVLAMRRCGLLMTPEAHQLHHDTLTRDFATNSGWSNPVVNRLFALSIRRGWLTERGLVPE